ncbi:MAG TPA: hypothetical protein VGK93_10960 [Candidatus Eisenbacteria bacterium]|jgi:hypothetical protein
MRRLPGSVALLLGLLLAAPVAAGPRLSELRGHLGVGYAKLLVTSAPGGSMSASGGLDYPLTQALRLGAEVGYDLLGSRTEERGSLVGQLDYSLFETLALLHWSPERAGPIERLSIGPGVFNARADLTSSGAAAFSDLPVEQTAAGAAMGLTLMSRKPAPVRLGFELAGRLVWLRKEDWSLLKGRVVVHY